MKTGRLIKFHRPGGDVHAYVYREGNGFRASVYLMTPERRGKSEPLQVFQGPTDAGVVEELRAWVERHYPRSG